ncbi:hypothetical protein IWZ03DRAFT_379085 [Phyllosticta citriasiana]|uniref:Uncharacterized protein n=1 Tax=Phyllosticta citriasiana TaxID=595635 RepID=A0ABR1KLL3_9PEZI
MHTPSKTPIPTRTRTRTQNPNQKAKEKPHKKKKQNEKKTTKERQTPKPAPNPTSPAVPTTTPRKPPTAPPTSKLKAPATASAASAAQQRWAPSHSKKTPALTAWSCTKHILQTTTWCACGLTALHALRARHSRARSFSPTIHSCSRLMLALRRKAAGLRRRCGLSSAGTWRSG